MSGTGLDIFGGIFDLDANEKITIDEKFAAYSLLIKDARRTVLLDEDTFADIEDSESNDLPTDLDDYDLDYPDDCNDYDLDYPNDCDCNDFDDLNNIDDLDDCIDLDNFDS